MNFVDYCVKTKNYSTLDTIKEYTKSFGFLNDLKRAYNQVDRASRISKGKVSSLAKFNPFVLAKAINKNKVRDARSEYLSKYRKEYEDALKKTKKYRNAISDDNNKFNEYGLTDLFYKFNDRGINDENYLKNLGKMSKNFKYDDWKKLNDTQKNQKKEESVIGLTSKLKNMKGDYDKHKSWLAREIADLDPNSDNYRKNMKRAYEDIEKAKKEGKTYKNYYGEDPAEEYARVAAGMKKGKEKKYENWTNLFK